MAKIIAWKWWIVFCLFLAGGAGAYWFTQRNAGEPEIVRAQRRDIIQTVVATGTVKPATAIKLEFISSGRVVSRPLPVGARVSQGQVIMALDARDLAIQIEKAEAVHLGAKAKLDQLLLGPTPETVRQLENARDAEYLDALSALDAVITKADTLMTTLRADVFQANNQVRTDLLLSQDAATGIAEAQKAAADSALTQLKISRNAIAPDTLDRIRIKSLLASVPAAVEPVRQVGQSATELLRKAVPSSISQATLNTYLDEITTARAGLDTALTAFSAANSAVISAEDALRVKIEPPRDADVAVLEANVASALADLELLKKQRADLAIVAPVNGVITDLAYEIGEIARPNNLAVSMNSSGNAEIEANIPEVNIARVALANSVSITLDALPGETFSGKVVHIDPAETVVDGVINYKVKIAFDQADSRIKTGTTANLSIETSRRPNAIALPEYVIVHKGDSAFVRKRVEGGEIQEFSVSIGMVGADGYREIISGVTEGEEILDGSGK